MKTSDNPKRSAAALDLRHCFIEDLPELIPICVIVFYQLVIKTFFSVKSVSYGYTFSPSESMPPFLTEDYSADLFAMITPYFSQIAFVVCFACAAACAMVGFFFLTEKKLCDMHLSLGISRKRIFLNRMIAGAGGIAIACLLPIAVSFVLNILAFGISSVLILSLLDYYLSMLTVFLTFYAAGVVSAIFCSGLLSGITCSLALSFLPVLISKAALGFADAGLHGWNYGDCPDAFPSLGFNPFDILSNSFTNSVSEWEQVNICFFRDTATAASFVPSLLFCVLRLAFLAAVTALAGYIFIKKFKPERISGGKKQILPAVAISLCLCMLCLVFYQDEKYMLTDMDEMPVYTEIDFLLLALLFALITAGTAAALRKKSFLKKETLICCTGFAAAVILTLGTVFSVNAGGFGFESRTFDPDDVKSVELDIHIPTENSKTTSAALSGICTGWFESPEDEKVNAEFISDALMLQELSAKGADAEKTIRADITVNIKLKNGGTVSRYYQTEAAEAQAALETIFEKYEDYGLVERISDQEVTESE